MLIDLQPFAEPLTLEARIGGRASVIGSARDCAEKEEAMRAALRALDSLEREGRFRLRARATWIFRCIANTRDAWNEFLTRPSAGTIRVDSQAVDRALSEPGGSVATLEKDLALAYDRVEPSTALGAGYEGD